MWLIFLLVVCAIYISYTDITRRRISNYQVLAVLGLSLLCSGFSALAPIALVIATVVGLVVFVTGAFAGGDIKLLLAFLPGIAVNWWPVVFFVMAVIGGVMALAYLGYGWWTNTLPEVRQRGLPYGVPISIAGLLGVLLTAS